METLTISGKRDPHADVNIKGTRTSLENLAAAINVVLASGYGPCSFDAFDEDGEEYWIQVDMIKDST